MYCRICYLNCFKMRGLIVSVNIYLVRHGEAGGAWDSTADPALSKKGISQADTMSRLLKERIEPVDIFSSPLKRAQETAKPSRQTEFQAYAAGYAGTNKSPAGTARTTTAMSSPSENVPFPKQRL